MPTSPALRRTAIVAGALALGVAGYLVGARGPRPAEATPAAPLTGVVDGVSVTPVARPTFEVTDAGSFFYGRAASQGGAPAGVDGALYSERVGECKEGCPVGMRMREGPLGLAQGATAVDSLRPDLQALETAAAAVAPEFATTLAAVRTTHAAWHAPTHPRTRRVFSLGMPRPDLGERATMVVFCAYDHCDGIFDLNRVEDCPSGGAHVLVARIEKHAVGGPRFEVMSGLVEVEERGEATGELSVAGPEAAPVMTIVSPVYMHFGGRRGRVRGLYLAPDGRLFAFGADRAPHALEATPALREAVVALLRRA